MKHVLLAGFLYSIAVTAAPPAGSSVTYNQDVLPILQKHCQTCHRPGEIAPMSFLSYDSTRPWAKAMKAAVLSRKMPPWTADPAFGHWANDLSLKQNEIDTIAAWADNGSLEGDAKGKPAPVVWPADGWNIQPDVVVAMPKAFPLPANTKEMPIPSFMLPNPFKEDTWVTAIEIRPGDRSVVHHVTISFPAHREGVKYGEPDFGAGGGDGTPPPPQGARAGGANPTPAQANANFVGFEAVYVPGVPPADYSIHRAAKLIKAGTDIRIGVHYTPNGKAVSDITRVAFALAKGTPERRFITMSPSARDTRAFKIPAGDPNFEVTEDFPFQQDAELVWFMPHMHYRGKDMTYRLIYPNGETQVALKSGWDFEWQLGFDTEKPLQVPKGTRMEVIAHYDNSAGNKQNPNPSEDVRWGNQTSQEMMAPWFGVVVPMNTDPKAVVGFAPHDKK